MSSPAKTHTALDISDVPIDVHCTGDRWTADNIDQLAKLIAIVVMGQAKHAANILRELVPAVPAFTIAELQKEAINKLTVKRKKGAGGYPRWQRDGLIFEIISWIAARQRFGDSVCLEDPHITSTSQGPDGLMIEMGPKKTEIVQATIFEDKCSDNPRETFRDKVIPAFGDRHKNKRSAELIASAASLIAQSGIKDDAAIKAAERVLDLKFRCYRASLALTTDYDSEDQRKRLFKGYNKLSDIEACQRIGASFIVDGNLRNWFDDLADRTINYLQNLSEGSS